MLLLLLLSRFSCVQLCATPQTAAHQDPPSLGFSRQEHWSGLPFPSPMHESEKWKWSWLSHVWLFATPWTAVYQAPPSMGFSRQEYWSRVPLPPLMKYEEFINIFCLVFLICHQNYTKEKLLNSSCRSIFGANWQELLFSSLSKVLAMPLDLKPWWGSA